LGARKNRRKRKSGRTFALVGSCAGKQERSWDTMIGQEGEACTDRKIGFPCDRFFVAERVDNIFLVEVRNRTKRRNTKLCLEVGRVFDCLVNLFHDEHIGRGKTKASQYGESYIENKLGA